MAAAIQQYADAACRRVDSCAPASNRWAYGGYSECVARMVLENAWEAALPGNVWTAGAMAACADAWKVAPCTQVFDPVQPAACNVPGTRASGEPCNAGSQCATSFCKTTGWTCGVCAAQPPTGAACMADRDCGAGVANQCMPNHTCQPARLMGQSCSDTLSCRSDLVCAQGQCTAAPSTPGATCDIATGLSCDWTHDLICSASRCVAFPGLALGASCTAASYCVKLGSCTNGTCQAGPTDTGACDDAARRFCEWPALCVSGKCQLPTNVPLCSAP
jgi:hypothetical protein